MTFFPLGNCRQRRYEVNGGAWKVKSPCAVLIIHTFISGHIHLWSSKATEVRWTRCPVQPRGDLCPNRGFLAQNYLCNKRLLPSSKSRSEAEGGGFNLSSFLFLLHFSFFLMITNILWFVFWRIFLMCCIQLPACGLLGAAYLPLTGAMRQ